MKFLFGASIWLIQLIYLVFAAIYQVFAQLVGSIISTTETHAGQNVERGKTFVKAYYFLEILEMNAGDTIDDANSASSTVFEPWSNPDDDNRIIRRAAAYSKQHHGGNQLPVIVEARARGFSG